MIENWSSKKSFFLLYTLIVAPVVILFILTSQDVLRLLFGLPWFLWPFIIHLVVFFIVVATPRGRAGLAGLEIPEKYSPKHLLLLLWLTGQAFLLGIVLHNGFYALFYRFFTSGGGDEAVFFVIAIIIVPAGFILGTIGRVWGWVVAGPAREMKARGIELPAGWPYFAPFGSYGWLWRFGRGIVALTGRRVRAGWVFAAVLLLGVIGFVIVWDIARRRLAPAKSIA